MKPPIVMKGQFLVSYYCFLRRSVVSSLLFFHCVLQFMCMLHSFYRHSSSTFSFSATQGRFFHKCSILRFVCRHDHVCFYEMASSRMQQVEISPMKLIFAAMFDVAMSFQVEFSVLFATYCC